MIKRLILYVKSYSLLIWAILSIGLILRLYVSLDPFLHPWDERYHALVAKNLTIDPTITKLYLNPVLEYNYQDWSRNHIWLHKQPLSLYLIASSIAIFGEHALTIRLPSIIFSTILIYYTYLIGRRLFNERIGLISGYFCAINGFIIELTGGRVTTDHPDTIFIALIAIGSYHALCCRTNRTYKPLLWSAIFTSLAVLTKWLPALIVLPILVISLCLSDRGMTSVLKKVIIWILIVLLTILPWQIYIATYYPIESTWEQLYNVRHLFEPLEGHGKAWYYYLGKITVLYNETVYIPLLWTTYKLATCRPLFKYAITFIWIFVPITIFSLAATKLPGYIMISAPAFFMASAAFVHDLFRKKELLVSTINFKWPIILLMLLVPLRYTFERVKPFQRDTGTEQYINEASIVSKPKSVLLNTPFPIESMFYYDVTAYEQLPSHDVIVSLQNAGYIVYIDLEGVNPIPNTIRENLDCETSSRFCVVSN